MTDAALEAREPGVSAGPGKTKSTNGKTGRSSNWKDSPTTSTGGYPKRPSDPWVAQIKRSNDTALRQLLRSLRSLHGAWVQCPACKTEWNCLTAKGLCIDCETKQST